MVTHASEICSARGQHLTADQDTFSTVRQVFDLPEIHAEITERHLTRRTCTCGCGTNPDAPVQYGPRVKASTVNLTCGQFVSVTRTAELLTDKLGISVSTGSFAVAQTAASGGLDPVIATLALLDVHPKRGRKAMNEGGVIPGLSDTLVHDAWTPYFCYEGVDHQLCTAHVQRELIAVIDYYEKTTGDRHCWAQKVLTAQLAVQKEVDRVVAARGGTVDPGVVGP